MVNWARKMTSIILRAQSGSSILKTVSHVTGEAGPLMQRKNLQGWRLTAACRNPSRARTGGGSGAGPPNMNVGRT